MNRNNRKRESGFTLMEVMVVVVIIGILATIAYPSYQSVVQQTRRTDAFNPLTDIMAKEERFFTDNNAYTENLTQLGFNVANNFTTPDGFYLVSAAFCVTGNSTCVRLTATGQNGQQNDSTCGTLTLDSTGTKTPTGCWKK